MMIRQLQERGEKVIVLSAIVIAASVVYGQWQERSVKQYCSELREGMAFEAVAALAERSGLIMPFTESENSDRLMVLNHMSPFFRYA